MINETENIPGLEVEEGLGFPEGEAEEGLEFPQVEEILEDVLGLFEDKKDYENLAGKIKEEDLEELSSYILRGVQQDLDSRVLWEEQYSRGFELLGLVKDKRESKESTNSFVFDSTMLNAVIANYARTMPNLFRNDISKYAVKGPKTDEVCNSGYKVQELVNDHLMNIDKGYKQDSKKMLMYLILLGCVFRKVYQDPLTNLPTARFIKPQNFIVNNNVTSLEEAERITHAYTLSKPQIMLREKTGFFIEDKSGDDENKKHTSESLSENNETPENQTLDYESPIEISIKLLDGVTDDYTNYSNFKYLETHVYLNEVYLNKLEKSKPKDYIPRPYIVTICQNTRKIVSIIRNWEEEDNLFTRKNCFVGYEYMPGYGFYGYGIVHLCGNNARALTTQMRQFIDSISYSLLQGGFKLGFKTDHNNIRIKPGEFVDLKTLEGSKSIHDMIMGFPYKQPSTTMLEAIRDLRSSTQDVIGAATSKMSDLSPHASEGTTLAFLEKHNEVNSVVVQSLVDSLREELNLIFNIFKENFKDEPYRINDSTGYMEITKDDFSDRIYLVPSCEPSLATVTQRIAKNDALLRIASSAPPGIFNLRVIYKNMVSSMDIGEVEDVLIPEIQPSPLDPVTENINCINGKPLQAFIEQDHDAHIPTHVAFMQANPQVQPQMMAHISDHVGKAYFLKMQKLMNLNIPQDAPLDMNTQNMIAMKAAEASQKLMEEINQQNNQNQQIDPTIALLKEVEQREKAAQLKYETDKDKIELEAYKTQLQFETDKKKMEVEEKIAEERNLTNIELENLKQHKGI